MSRKNDRLRVFALIGGTKVFNKRTLVISLTSIMGRLASLRSGHHIEQIRQDTGVDPFSLVDPELLPALNRNGTLSARAMRSAAALFFPPPMTGGLSTRKIPGAAGDPPIRIRIADPTPGGVGRPAYLHIHGGGYEGGMASASMDVARNCGCVVISVDYRLAPKTRFPGSLDDNHAALCWVFEHAEELGIDRNRIAVGGESAGGGHAAALALAARDRGGPPIIFQVLIYPMLDDRTGSSSLRSPFAGAFVWTPSDNKRGWAALLGQDAGLPDVPQGSVPARISDLSHLPPAWIGVGDLDLFADEDREYAERLQQAGVPVEFVSEPGAFHGFDLFMLESAVVKRFIESWQSALRRAFSHG